MRKTSKLLIGVATILLASCASGGENQSSSSSVAPSPSPSSSSGWISAKEGWSDEEKELISKYCGSVLPFSRDKFGDKVFMDEIEDEEGTTYLQIYDNALSFSLQDYYIDLEKEGWTAIKDFEGNVLQEDTSGTIYAELTNKSSDEKVGYEIIYFYSPSRMSGNVLIPPCNVIKCYNDLSATASEKEEWSAANKEDFLFALGEEVPFVKLGKLNNVVANYLNVVQMKDLYVTNLCASYAETLKNDGYVYDEAISKEYRAYYLKKTLSDGASIEAILRYLNGNTFYFIYTANPTELNAWPTDLVNEIKEKTNVEIPVLDIKTGGKYRTYKKADTYYIEGDTDIDNPTWVYDDKLEKIHLTQADIGYPYTNFEETISLEMGEIYDTEYNTVGVRLGIRPTKPTSSFVSSWPEEAISSTIKNLLKVDDFSLPALSSLSSLTDSDIKYSIRGEDYINERYEYYLDDIAAYPSDYEALPTNYTDEDIKNLALALATAEAGIVIKIEDKSAYASSLAYEKILTNESYYRDYESNGSTTSFEDKDGKIGIDISTSYSSYTSYGITTIFIHGGSKVVHNPEFRFSKEIYNASIGNSTKLTIIKNMLPYDVTYSCKTSGFSVDNNGIVTVSSEVAEGTIATITASLVTNSGETYTATCEVKATALISYTAESAIDQIILALEDDGYEGISRETYQGVPGFYYPGFEIKAQSGKSLVELEEHANVSWVPNGFNAKEGDGGKWVSCEVYKPDGSGILLGKGVFTDYVWAEEGEDKVQIAIYFYSLSDKPDELIIRVIGFNLGE